MATRRERVVLDLEDNLTPGLARAAVAASVLDKSLNDLGKSSTRTSKDVDLVGDSATRVGRKSGDGSKEIDKLSGRLRLLRDAAILLGPAIAPLGAATIPVLVGSLTAFGAAAGGIGASVLALKGMGDALKSLDAYQLEPTAENLQAMRVEMEKLGPAGAHFVRYLDGIESQLSQLQIAAREGLLPGLEDGIDSALERLPGVRKVIRELAEGMGELARSAGEDLKPGGDWDNFFKMLDKDGKNAVMGFGEALGNIVNGLADMIVAFAPLSRDFQYGFQGMAEAFADWAAGLGDNASFQEFLDYIRVNGPRAIDMLGSLVSAFASIVEAVAPIGAVTLPILTQFLDLIGAFASSDLGTPFLAAVVGITAMNNAIRLAEASQTKFNAAAKLNPYLLVAATIAATVTELQAANDSMVQATENGQDALRSLDPAELQAAYESLNATLDEYAVKAYPEPPSGFWENFKDAIPLVGGLNNGLDQAQAVWVRLTGAQQDAADTASQVDDALNDLGRTARHVGGTDALVALLGETSRRLKIATRDAEAFSGALAELNGWLDKRQALRDFNASTRELSRTMRNGFTRKDVENLDDVAGNIAKVASQIKDKGVRAEFLADAQRRLEHLAKNAGPEGQKAIQKVIDKMTELGLFTAQPKVKLDKDQFDRDLTKARNDVFGFDGLHGTAYLNVVTRHYDQDQGTGRGPTRGDDESRIASRSFGRGDVGANAGKAALFNESLKASQGLAQLNHQLAKAEQAVERERRQRDALVSKMDEVRGSVRGDLSGSLFEASGDPWAAGAASMNPFAALAERKARAQRFLTAIRELKRKGVTGAALQEILGEGLEAAEYMAAQSSAALGGFSSEYAATAALINQAANAGANAAYGADLSVANAELKEANKRLHRIEQAIKQSEKSNKGNHDRSAARTEKAIGGVGRAGKRRAHV